MLDQTQGRPILSVEEFAPGTLKTPDGRPVVAMSIYAGAPADGRIPYAVSVLLDDGQIRTAVSFYANGTLATADGRPVLACAVFDALGAPTTIGAPVLDVLGLSNYSIAEGSGTGTTVGTITGLTAGSTPTLVNDAGGRFQITTDGSNYFLKTAGVATNYEAAASHLVTIQEDLVGASNTPRQTELTVTVTNVLEVTLAALGGTFTLPENAPIDQVAGAITGKSSGSTLTLTDDAGGRVALLGTNIVRGATALDYETATSHSFQLTETHPDATNSPRVTNLTLTVTDVVEGGGTGTISTPFIELNSNLPGDSPPTWNVNFVDPGPTGADYGDTIECRYGTSLAAMTALTPVQEILDEGEMILGDPLFPEVDTWAAAQAVGTTIYWQVRVVRVAGVEESDWSDPASFAIVDGIADTVAFTDKTNVVIDTFTWSDPITIAGLAAGAYSRFTVAAGGFLRVNGGAAIDSTGEAIVQNGDTLAVGVQSSALSGTPVNVAVSQRGAAYDTFTVTTAGASAIQIDPQGFGQSGAGTTSYTFPAVSFGAAEATRKMIAVVGTRKGTGGNSVPTSVTIGGVAATMLAGAGADSASGNVCASLWIASVPTGTSGDVVVNHAAAVSRCSVRLYSMINGLLAALSSGTQIGITTGTTLTASPTIPANAILIAASVVHSTGGTNTWAGATESFDSYLTSNLSSFSGALSDVDGTPTLTVTTPSSSSRSMAWAVMGQA